MRIAKTVSITLPPEMLLYATKTAKLEHRSMSELIREALRCYQSMRAWGAVRDYTQARASQQVVTEEEIVAATKTARKELWPEYRNKKTKARPTRKPRNG